MIIAGTGFTGATAVTFGLTPAAGFTVDSDTQITAIAPAGGPGTVGVTVTTPGGTSVPSPYLYIAAPTVLVLSPDAGPEGGGTPVVITGTGFNGATAVTFGATPAVSFTVDNDNQITATAPIGVGAAGVTVTTSGGISNPGIYTYVPFPVITGINPVSGPAAGGTAVTISGSNFTGATSVTFGGTPAASFTVDNDGQITATTAAHAAGAVSVDVTTTGGTDSFASFTYL
ncbi:IPT/TIG domain-containing protein [Nocardia sp. 004]|uniref:IPT/TIG domain-containing protein n=1 Tax=Nocardia sp. 004 TaxID=3385978 RepID=UPI00399FA3E8